MKDRIIKFLTTEGISATKFADEIGVQRSSISHILSGRNNPSFEFIQKILNRYRTLNAEWLILGTGTMFKKSDNISSPVQPENTGSNKAVNNETQLNFFNTASNEPKSTPVKEIIQEQVPFDNKIEPSRRVEKILIFYSDKTFDEFFPSK